MVAEEAVVALMQAEADYKSAIRAASPRLSASPGRTASMAAAAAAAAEAAWQAQAAEFTTPVRACSILHPHPPAALCLFCRTPAVE